MIQLHRLLFGAGILTVTLVGIADTPSASQLVPPVFDVASIRPHPGLATLVAVSISGSRVTVSAHSLLALITYAYELEPYQVVRGPKWLESDHFDIAARAEGEVTPTRPQVRLMLQQLLATRFQLKSHRETKQLPVFGLVVAKNGPKLRASAPDAESSFRIGGRGQVTVVTVTKGSVDQLAKQLCGTGLGRPVLDRTGLKGPFDFRLLWSRDQSLDGPELEPASTAPGRPPTIFTALQEQLGLKLESQKGPVEVLVIDSAKKPSLD
jgi:uncharacterized protein (TIGR03435 family)